MTQEDLAIKFENRGNTYFRNESSVCFSINGDDYWFTMIEEGDMATAPSGNRVDFESDDDLPFELTEEMKDIMYELACVN